MQLEDLIAAFSQRQSLSPPAPDGQGGYTLYFDDDLAMHCIPAGKDEIILWAGIGKIPSDSREAEDYLKRLLRIHLAGMRDRREALSLERETGEIVLYIKTGTGEMTPWDFEQTVESFANSMEQWTEIAGKAPEKQPPSPFSVIFP